MVQQLLSNEFTAHWKAAKVTIQYSTVEMQMIMNIHFHESETKLV